MVKNSNGALWSNEMMGKKINPTFIGPFAMNTHLGFVGGTLDGEPIIYHNVGGVVHVDLLSAIKNDKMYPVWVKQGNYSAAPAAPAGEESPWYKKATDYVPDYDVKSLVPDSLKRFMQ
jgi:hypothetical protein